MHYIRDLLRKERHELKQEMISLLGTKWKVYNTFLWATNNTLSGLDGNSVFQFIDLIDDVIFFMNKSFVSTTSQDNLLHALKCWTEIVPFLRIMYIINRNDTMAEQNTCKEDYDKLLVSIKDTIRHFYLHAAKSFMKKVINGDTETFYMHALRHYILKHAQDTWTKYKLGVGIFTMEGFERRNKESKEAVRKHTNKKDNITIQSCNKLYEKYNA